MLMEGLVAEVVLVAMMVEVLEVDLVEVMDSAVTLVEVLEAGSAAVMVDSAAKRALAVTVHVVVVAVDAVVDKVFVNLILFLSCD